MLLLLPPELLQARVLAVLCVRSRKALRLTCRALRALVDVSITSLAAGVQIADLPRLPRLPSLRLLHLGLPRLGSLEALRALTSLQQLELHGCRALGDPAPLGALASLQRLELRGCRAPRVRMAQLLSALQPLARLQRLHLDCKLAARADLDLQPLGALGSLTHLSVHIPLIEGLMARTDSASLAPLAGLQELQELRLQGCKARDLGALAGLRHLRCIALEDGSDLSDLSDLPSLREVHASNWLLYDVSALQALALPNLQVSTSRCSR